MNRATMRRRRLPTERLYQHNLRIVIPFVVSTRGYGVPFDTCSAMTFADGARGLTTAPRRGRFAGMQARRRFKVVVGRDGKTTDFVYDGRAVTIQQ